MILQGLKCPPYKSFKLGTVADALSPDCRIHRPLLLMAFPRLSLKENKISQYLNKTVSLMNLSNSKFEFRIQGHYLQEYLMLSNNNRNASYRGIGRVIDSEWIDTRLIRVWKSTCDVKHGKSCRIANSTPIITRHRPDLLIDTWRMCLTMSSSAESYIALSYVWGQAPTLKTVQASLEDFQQPGSLGREEIASQIPRTIRDAIALTGLLHKRYLWVDSLCIVQDDKTTSHDQIARMASIYANAELTIVDAGGDDANYGLRGLRRVSFPRNRPQQIGKLPNGVQIVKEYYPSPNSSAWSKRGWTFQESLFSKRKLIFCGNSVQWLCACKTLSEDRVLDLQTKSPLVSYDFGRTWPDILGYQRLVYDFNKRELTYPEDVVDAFSGITTPLSMTFQGGFFYGLPEMFFDVAMLWQAWSPMKRRVPTLSVDSNLRLPSWSWMGWQGLIRPWSWGNGGDYIKSTGWSFTSLRTVPLVQWYIHGGDQKSTRQINCSSLRHRDSCIANSIAKLPSGWSRYRYDPQAYDREVVGKYPEYSIPKYFFKHESDEKAEFWYPIPISQVEKIADSSVLFPFISCRTSRCWLRVEVMLPYNLRAYLRDGTGAWAGALNCNNIEDLQPFSSTRSSRKGSQCELISISKGYALNSFEWDRHVVPELGHKERPKSSELYEFYNVLWIEWKEGIAYRKGSGRVEKSMWEAQPLEWIDVTLG
jgi:hypothetical protein